MERRAVGRDLGLTARMVVVATLVVVLYALLAFGFWTAVRAYPILWVVLPLFLFLGYEGGSHWGGSLAKSDLVSGSDARRALPPIEAMVERLSALADVPRPRVALVSEFAADRASAVLTGAPEQLMSALQKIAGELDAIRKRDLRAAAGMNGFFIVPVAQPRWFELAPSHPPLHKRIAELAELARGMGNVA